MATEKDQPDREGSRFERVSPSSLPVLETCPRAYAIQRDYDAARKAHPDLPEDRPSYKMVFGSIFHKVIETQKREPKDIYKIAKDMIGDSGLEFDAAYAGVKDVAKGVHACVKSFKDAPESQPWRKRTDRQKVEQRLEAEIEGIKVSGIVDMIDDGEVIDLKTTTSSSRMWYGSQLTAYQELARANSEGIKDDVSIVKVFRPRKPDGASGVASVRLSGKDNRPHVRQLFRTARAIRDRRDEWRSDYRRLAMNPNSGRCGYCPARATTACPETRTW